MPSGEAARPGAAAGPARPDAALRPLILRVFGNSYRVCGERKFWRQFGRKGFHVARCTVASLMNSMGIRVCPADNS